MENFERTLFNAHPHATYVALSGVLSMFSLGPTPGMIPIILNLAVLLTYSRKLFPTYSHHTARRTAALWASLTVGGSIPRLSASLHALSQPAISIASLLFLSGTTSFLSIGALYLDMKVNGRSSSGIVRLFLFPAIWSTFWRTIAYLSPLGTLSTWSPVEGTGAYDWLVPLLGPESINWVVAAWAVVISQAVTYLYMGPKDDEEELPTVDLLSTDVHVNGYSHDSSAINTYRPMTEKHKIALLAAMLVLLTVPSYLSNSLPLPIEDPDRITPLVVGCALPRGKHQELTFDDFLEESKKIDSAANFILWPEGAVRFKSKTDREYSLAKVQADVKHAFVGVSFEEPVNPEESTGRKGVRRNGIAIVSNTSSAIHLLYFKRHLAPIAESFSLSGSREPLEVFEGMVRMPKWMPHIQPRPVNVTTSICLDFSAPSVFEDLTVRPGLILAPARTWDVTVGYTMWKQASQRAHEIGSTVLWCDGGAGGVSGVAGHGYNEVVQVGSGSWVRSIGLGYGPSTVTSRRTFYARYPNSALFLFWALVVGHHLVPRLGGNITAKWFRRRPLASGPLIGNLLED